VSTWTSPAQAVTLVTLLISCRGFAPPAVHRLTQNTVLKHALPARQALHSARSICCSLAEPKTASAFSYDDAISPLISSIAPSKTIEVFRADLVQCIVRDLTVSQCCPLSGSIANQTSSHIRLQASNAPNSSLCLHSSLFTVFLVCGSIVQVHALTKEMEARGEPVVSLCVGEPDFPPPPAVIEATIEVHNTQLCAQQH
jgi:hypothetical protein